MINDLDSVSSEGNLGAYAIGTEGALWNRIWDGTVWSAWQSLGGSIIKLRATVLE
jgi:hypothetical protein